MTTNKKLVILIAVMLVAIVSVMVGIVVVLVATGQSSRTVVNVKYVAEDVWVDLSANAYIGSNVHEFTKDGEVADGTNTVITLSPDNTEGMLSQQENIVSLELSKEHQFIIFEYIFINRANDIDVNIHLENIPGDKFGEVMDNIVISYAFSDTKVEKEDFATMEFASNYVDQKLSIKEGESNTKYIYIKATIDKLLYDAELRGNFGWALSKISE